MPSDVSEVLKPTLDKFSKMTEKIGVDDFILVKTLGRGTFGKVMLVQKKRQLKILCNEIHTEREHSGAGGAPAHQARKNHFRKDRLSVPS